MSGSPVTVARQAMATRFEVALFGGDPVALRAAAEEALDEVQRVETMLNWRNPASPIAHLNARASAEPVRVNPEPGRPSGYEETGWMARDIPGVGVTAASSVSANHTYEMTADNFTDVGHSAFLIDAKTEAAMLYDFLTDRAFRTAVETEFKTLSTRFDQYLGGLRAAYKDEIGR